MRGPNRLTYAALVFLAATAAAIALVIMCNAATAQTDPPSTGDWTVSDTTLVKDTVIGLQGSLYVTGSGRLTLENVTLRIALSSDGEHGIEVASGGRLTIRDGDGLLATADDNSIVTSNPGTYAYSFILRSGSSLRLTDTIVEHCGYTGGLGTESQGLYVATDNAVLRGLDVRSSLFGLIVDSGTVDAQDCSFSNCTYQGVIATTSTVLLKGCTMADDGYDGVRAIGGTTVVDRTVIHHCRFGVVARTLAVMTVTNSTIHSNEGGMLVEQGFRVTVVNCTIVGHSEYGIDAEYNGRIDVRDSVVTTSQRAALYAFTGVVATSSNSAYESSVYGIRVNLNSRVTSTGDSIAYNTNSGVFLEQGSSIALVGSTLKQNGVGVSAETGTSVVAWSARMDASIFEGYKLTGASLVLHDGVVTNCSSGGVVPDGASTASWTAHAGNASALIGCSAELTSDMVVGGDLNLTKASLTFRTGPVAHPGIVCTGGHQAWENSTVSGTDPANGFKLEVLSPASGYADHLKVDGAGWSEASPSSEGAHVATAFTFRQCTFTNGLRGVVVTSGRVLFDRCTFSSDKVGARVNGAQARFENCTFSGDPEDGRLGGGAGVDMVNCSFAPAKVTISDGSSQLRIWWTVHVEVSFPSGQPAGGAVVTVDDRSGAEVARGTTDARGKLVGLLLLQSVVMRDSRDDRTPHAFGATLGGAQNTTSVSVTSHMTVRLKLTDSDMPVITVTSHVDGAFIRDPILVLRGTANDAGSGILDVSVRISTQPWETAVGTTDWQWRRTLPGDGTYPIFIRARDLALNEAIVELNLTLDTRAPRVYVETPPSPQNGSTVGGTHVELVGYVDDATATVSWGGVNATMQGSSFDLNVTLVSGENLIGIVARDPAGNTAVVVWRLIADLAAPPLVVDHPGNNSLLNTLDVDIDGTTQPGADLYYQILDRMTSWLMLTVNPAGHFAGKLSELGEGRNVVVVRSRNAVGNEATVTLVVTIDTVAPKLVSMVPPDGAYVNTRNGTVELKGTFSEPLVQLNILGHPASLDRANFSMYVPLVEGPNRLSLSATDLAGNTAYINMILNLDTVAPKVTLNEIRKNETSGAYDTFFTNKQSYTLSGQTDVGCTVLVDGWAYPVDSQGRFSAELNLTEGQNLLHVTVVDRAGNSVRFDLPMDLDTVPPVLMVETPKDRSRTSGDYVHVRGSTTPGDTIDVGGQRLIARDGTFDMSVPLGSSITRLVVVASDRAGNTATESRLVFRSADTSGLTGVKLLDSNCLSIYIVLIVLGVVLGAAAAVSGRGAEAEELEEENLRKVLEEDRIQVQKPQYEPSTGSLEYGMGLAPARPAAPGEDADEDEDFISMDDFRRQLEGEGQQ